MLTQMLVLCILLIVFSVASYAIDALTKRKKPICVRCGNDQGDTYDSVQGHWCLNHDKTGFVPRCPVCYRKQDVRWDEKNECFVCGLHGKVT